MPAPAEIKKLVEKFAQHREDYVSGKYNETQVRRDFIDPFLKALGWDVDNSEGASERYREVVHEDRVMVGGESKAPDYSCRLGGNRVFFIEAKKPGVDLKNDPAPAFQLRRYAWSAKLPISVLTDFDELVIYDTTAKPGPKDKATVGRLRYWTSAEFIEKWDEIAAILSKEAVKSGAFDKFAGERKRKAVAQVDDDFLEAIEGWREVLARDIAKHNGLDASELSAAVQLILDRIIFLRICEDRGIEQPQRLLSQLDGDGVYPRLVKQFRDADRRYNSGLFHFKESASQAEPPDTITPALEMSDKALRSVVGALYGDESWVFAVIPADILGSIYERFLGKTIRITAGGIVKIDPKPEVRKTGGVYYTPKHIVDRIVRETIEIGLEGKTVAQASTFRVLDPACGSGSFLIEAYQSLLDWHLDRYRENPSKHKKELVEVADGVWRLTVPERRRILVNSIFGVDIDPQAVEVTKLSLLLKVLEGGVEKGGQIALGMGERMLPDLGSNIKCGNSLIGNDALSMPTGLGLDWEAARPFGFESEFPQAFDRPRPGFDAVIGNPPYDVLEKDRGKSSWPHDLLAEYVGMAPRFGPALGGKLNLFRFFVVAAVQLTRPKGRLGMIVPLSMLGDISCAATRLHLASRVSRLMFDCFPQKDNAARRVFRDAKLSTVVFTGEVSDNEDEAMVVRVYPWNSFEDSCSELSVRPSELKLLDPDTSPLPLTDQANWNAFVKLFGSPHVQRLGDVESVKVTRGEINQTIYRRFIRSDGRFAKLVKGAEIGPFGVWSEISQGAHEYFDEKEYLKEFDPRPETDLERVATQRITGVDEWRRVVAARVSPRAYFADSTNSLRVQGKGPLTHSVLLAILNSNLAQWRFRLTSTNNNVGTNELLALPCPTEAWMKASGQANVERIERLVEHAERALSKLASARELASAKGAHARKAMREIDEAVCDLFDLDVATRECVGAIVRGGEAPPA